MRMTNLKIPVWRKRQIYQTSFPISPMGLGASKSPIFRHIRRFYSMPDIDTLRKAAK